MGWVFDFVTMAVMAGNVLNLLPLAIAGLKRLKAKRKYEKAVKRQNKALKKRLEKKRIADEKLQIKK